MTVVVPGRDPLGSLDFLMSAHQLRFSLDFTKECPDWRSLRYRTINELDTYLDDSMYDFLLGDEEKLTSTSAEFVLYVEAEFVDKARHYIEYRKSPV